MSLPPGFLDELRARVPLSRIIGRKVTWDTRRSRPGKGDMWAPCPFHQEKTASFHCDDAKGFYYCFGCHAKGDAITFLREAENLSFREAVEVIAAEAGMSLPAPDPQTAARDDRRTRLREAIEAAERFFRLQLNTAAGAGARDYLAGRGLDRGAQERFAIGYAPEARGALTQALTGQGLSLDLLDEAGLVIRPDDGGSPHDRFRHRVIFPIRDARGRTIAFGGRALSSTARAKYLNSPETPLFDKGRTLYNHALARAAVGGGAPLVVAEGYMDVIALSEAGFAGAVAPLGTAITETQLRLLWQMSDEPVIALDGDAAGLRAGLRLIDLALPVMVAGQGLRFAALPPGQDPDDLLRAGGRAAMAAVLEGARPMADLIWQAEMEGRTLDSPERRAAFDKALRARLNRIADRSLRAHFADDFRTRRAALFGQRPTAASGNRGALRAPGSRRGIAPPAEPSAATRASLLARAGDDSVAERLGEAMVLAILSAHPALIAPFEAEIEALEMLDPDHAALRDGLLRLGTDATEAVPLRDSLDEAACAALEKVLSARHVALAPPVRNTGDADMARMCLAEELAKLSARRGVRREIDDALADIGGLVDEGLTWRLTQANAARHRAEHPELSDATDLGEDRAALSQKLQAMIETQVWVKKKR